MKRTVRILLQLIVLVCFLTGCQERIELKTVQSYVSEPTPLENKWLDKDIGIVRKAGSSNYNSKDGVYSLKGSGNDIWDNEDSFHFTYKRVKGNYKITARVTGMDYTHEWAKAGVMVREDLTAGSRHAMTAVTPHGLAAFQFRPEKTGSSCSSEVQANIPQYVKLVRQGNMFYSYISPDGSDWELLAVYEIPMSEYVYIGMAVSSHNNEEICSAAFTDVEVIQSKGVPVILAGNTSKTIGSWTDRDIGMVTIPGDAVYNSKSGIYTLKAAGKNISGMKDTFNYLYKSLKGDGQITAQVLVPDNTDKPVTAGLMMRAAAESNSKCASVLISGSGKASMQGRIEDGKASYGWEIPAEGPCWLMLKRNGDIFSGYCSLYGNNWKLVGAEIIKMPKDIKVGLAVMGNGYKTLSQSSFSNVNVGLLKKIKLTGGIKYENLYPGNTYEVERIYDVEYGKAGDYSLKLNIVKPKAKISAPCLQLYGFTEEAGGQVQGLMAWKS